MDKLTPYPNFSDTKRRFKFLAYPRSPKTNTIDKMNNEPSSIFMSLTENDQRTFYPKSSSLFQFLFFHLLIFFVFLRLFILIDPIFIIFSRLLVNYILFTSQSYLLIYFISFIFILSRIIFHLTDFTPYDTNASYTEIERFQLYWRRRGYTNKKSKLILQPTFKNARIYTLWAIRLILLPHWETHLYKTLLKKDAPSFFWLLYDPQILYFRIKNLKLVIPRMRINDIEFFVQDIPDNSRFFITLIAVVIGITYIIIIECII